MHLLKIRGRIRYQIKKGHHKGVEVRKMSRHGIIEEVATMIRTGASEKTVSNYVDDLLRKEEITTRVYDLLIGMIIDNY